LLRGVSLVKKATTITKRVPTVGKVLSRREFLGRAALASAGVAAFGMVRRGRTAVAHTGVLSHGGYTDAITHRALDGLNSFINWLAGAQGYIGELGIPSNLGQSRDQFAPDQEQWRALGEAYYSRCDAAGLWVTAQEASERYYGLSNCGYHASIYLASGDDRHKVISRPGYQSELIEAHLGAGRGINFSGGQKFDESLMSNANPGVYDTDYWYPTAGSHPVDPSTGLNSFGYLASRGVKLVRLGIRWERIQPSLNNLLSSSELWRYRKALANAEAVGLKVVVDLHNYGGYCTSTGRKALNSSALPISAFVDVWRRLSRAFADNSAVVAYDLMNEPYNHGGIEAGSYPSPQSVWEATTQKVVDAIRARGDVKKVMVPTYGPVRKVAENHATPWITGGGDIAYTAHHYFDHYDGSTDGGGGTYPISYDDENAYYASKGY
jgi:hypothetical protein